MIWELRHKHKISLRIEVSGLPCSTYYYYTKRRTQPDKYSEIKEQITGIYNENKGRYGTVVSRLCFKTKDTALITKLSRD